MKATSQSRIQIVWLLLGLALVGAGTRLLAPNPSFTRDLGNLLLVLWIPVIGNVVAWVIVKFNLGPKPPPDFERGSIFIPHVQAEMIPLAPGVLAKLDPIAPDERRCALVIGKDAITVRLPLPLVAWLDSRRDQKIPLQFLRPDLAMERFPPGTAFSVLVGTSIVGQGHVLQQMSDTADPTPGDPDPK